MSKIAYCDPKNMRAETKTLLLQITNVIEEYLNQGFKLTLRQLYYQLVVEKILSNNKAMYSKLVRIVSDGRRCGQIDWNVVEDRGRILKSNSEWDSIDDLINNAVASYRKDRHVGQKNYVEVWVEKDALTGILLPVTQEYHVNLLANRGYSSDTALQSAAERFRGPTMDGKSCTVLYLGDHDPSGLDMVRDIKRRLQLFRSQVNVIPIAITKQQIKKYNLPPDPAKITDPRARWYIEEHGNGSWELDALKPQVLHQLLQDNLEDLIDMNLYNKIVQEEEHEKQKLIEISRNI